MSSNPQFEPHPLPTLPPESSWTVVAEAGVIKGRRHLRVKCSCPGSLPVLRRASNVLTGRSMCCEICAPKRRGAKKHQNSQIGDRGELEVHSIAEDSPQSKISHRQKHDRRVVRPGCGCSVCGYNRAHWHRPIPMSMIAGKPWQAKLKSFDLELTRGMSLGNGNIKYVGGTQDIIRLDDYVSSLPFGENPLPFGRCRTAAGRDVVRPNQDPDIAYESIGSESRTRQSDILTDLDDMDDKLRRSEGS